MYLLIQEDFSEKFFINCSRHEHNNVVNNVVLLHVERNKWEQYS